MLITDDSGLSGFKLGRGEEGTGNRSKNYNLAAKSKSVEMCAKCSVKTGEKDPDPENSTAEIVSSHGLKVGRGVFRVDQGSLFPAEKSHVKSQ